jgi:hypothetical protein
MKKSAFIAGTLLVLFCGTTQAEKPSPAVLKLCMTAKGLRPDAITNAAREITSELDGLGTSIPSRQEKVTARSTCCRNSRCILAAGRSLGVRWVLNVSMIRVGPLVSVTFRTYDTRTGKKRFQTSLTSILEDFPSQSAVRHHLERTLEVLRMDGKPKPAGAAK